MLGFLLISLAFLGQQEVTTTTTDAATCELQVHLLNNDGKEITTRRYVAAVASGGSWVKPTAERLFPADDSTPILAIPAGTYRVACAAQGFSPVWIDDVKAEGKMATATCRLQPLTTLPGVVVSTKDRKPIPGARVGSARVLAGGDAFEVSELAQPLIFSQLATTTDKDGKFLLPVGATGSFPLWVEANGFQPLYLPGTSVIPPLPLLTLRPGGGSLTVKLDTGNNSCDGCRLDLVAPVRLRGPHPALPPYLLRRLVRHDGIVSWTSLPDGVYRIRALAPKISPEGAEIAHVFVGGGRHTKLVRTMTNELPAIVNSVPGLSFVVADPPDPPAQLELQLWRPGAIEKTKPQWRTSLAGSSFSLKESCQIPCFLLVSDTTGRVGGIDLSLPQGGGESVSLVLFPAGLVSGKITVPAGVAQPKWAYLVPEWCGDEPQEGIERLGSYPFAIKDDGTWEVSLPVGCLRLRVRAAGFVEEKVNPVEVPAGARTAIGAVELHPGGEIQARLVDTAGNAIGNAAVAAVPESEDRNVSKAKEDNRREVVHPNAKGWVTLKGVMAGKVLLRVTCPGHIPFFSQPIEVRAGQVIVLDPLELEPPASLTVRIKRKSDIDDIDPLTIWVSSRDEKLSNRAVFSTNLEKDGVANFDEVPPGHWQIEVRTIADRGGQRLAHSSVTLIPGGHDEVSLEVAATTYKGRVTLRNKPIAGTLEFRPTKPGVDKGDVTRGHSNEDGYFSVLTTAPGRYSVQVRSSEGRLWHAGPVVFDDPDKDVEIQIPASVVRGIVVDLKGRAVEHASVRADQPREEADATPEWPNSRSAVSTGDGTFEIDDLGPGTWSVGAKKGEDASDPVRVSIQGDENIADLKLVLQSDTVVGYVLDAAGGGVGGRGWCIVPPANLLDVPPIGRHRFDTDTTGAFKIHLTPEERKNWASFGLGCIFCAAGRPVTAVRAIDTGSIQLQVPPLGGHLTIRAPAEFRRTTNLLSLILVAPNGAFIHLRLLNRNILPLAEQLEAASGDQPVILPLGLVPVGTWRAVLPRNAAELNLVFRGFGWSLVPLGQVDVVAGGVIDLVLHSPK